MTAEALRDTISRFLQNHNTLSLATAGRTEPWAASVFYASDDALHLYFVTDPTTHHGQDLTRNSRVAGTINADCADWTQIRGLQLSGHAAQVSAEDRPAALAIYLDKFPAVARMMDDPASDQERLIGERLAATPLYQLRPSWVRLIDNAQRFGFKQELMLGS
jgi:uncharacterized protein YhbP (UPF0306 family)